MPLTQGLDIEGCVQEHQINATDVDFSTKNIKFTIEPDDDFEIESEQILETKTFFAKIKSKKLLKFSETKEYKIIAEDVDGTDDDRRQGETKLIINVDAESYTPSPSFDNAFYVFNYDINNDGSAILSKTIDITLNDGKLIDVSLAGKTIFYFILLNR